MNGADRTRELRLLSDSELLPASEALKRAGSLVPGAARSVLVPAGELTVELVEGSRVVGSETVRLAPRERRRIVLEPR